MRLVTRREEEASLFFSRRVITFLKSINIRLCAFPTVVTNTASSYQRLHSLNTRYQSDISHIKPRHHPQILTMPARTPIDKALNSRVSSPNGYTCIITNTDSRTPSLVTIPPDAALNLATDNSQPSPESSQQQPCGPYGAVICSQHSQIPPEVCLPHSSLVFLPLPRAKDSHVSFRAHHPTPLVHPHFPILRHLQC